MTSEALTPARSDPTSNPVERFRRLEAIFHQASELRGKERDQYLDQACGNDGDLRREAEQMLGLNARDHAEQWVDQAVDAGLAVWSAPQAPERIGPYRILELLGQGGLGAVYLAERDDEHFHKRVAIKCVRPELALPALERRLRAERQILAALDHPYIARILDGGTHAGASYIVMELVEGEQLLDYCRRHELTVGQKLKLFREICSAVHYAHQSLILHCDLKPSNILVDAQGTPKLLDFGIAKALQGQGNPDTQSIASTLTAQGIRALTPDYASPEQAKQRPLTTSSDIYSLGVILYEMLCDQRPYVIDTDSFFDIAETIAKAEAPAPSSHFRNHPTSRSRRAPWGADLDAVVAKAIRKEPDQRYRSAEQLAEDIGRYLENRPVTARHGTWLYTWSKLLRRHRWAVLAVSTVVVSLLTATVVTSRQADLARQERRRAEANLVVANDERDRSKALVELMVGMFEVSDPGQAQGAEITARELLDRSAERIPIELREQPKLRADLAVTIGRIYRELALTEPAERLLIDSLEIRRAELEPGSPKIVESLLQLGLLRLRQDRIQEAADLLGQGLEKEVETRGTGSLIHGELLRALALCRLEQDRTQEARQLLERSLGPEPISTGVGLNGRLEAAGRADAWDLLAQIAYTEGSYDEAEDFGLKGYEGRRRALGSGHPKVATSLNNVAAIRQAKGDLAGAREALEASLDLRRQVYGENHDAVALSLQNLANIHLQEEDLAAAETCLQQAASILERIYGSDHNAVADVLQLQAVIQSRRGRWQEAVDLQRQALNIRRARMKPGHPDVIQGLVHLGDYHQGEHPDREAAYREAVALSRRHGSDNPNPDHLAYPLERLGGLLCHNNPAEGVKHLREAWNLRRQGPSPERWSTAMAQAKLGRCELTLDHRQGLDHLRQAAALLETRLGPEHRKTQTVMGWIAEAERASAPQPVLPQ